MRSFFSFHNIHLRGRRATRDVFQDDRCSRGLLQVHSILSSPVLSSSTFLLLSILDKNNESSSMKFAPTMNICAFKNKILYSSKFSFLDFSPFLSLKNLQIKFGNPEIKCSINQFLIKIQRFHSIQSYQYIQVHFILS